MKLVYRTLFVAFLAMGLLLPACNRADDDGVSAAPETRENLMEEQRDAYVETVEAKLDEFDQKFDGLEERAATMQGTTKQSFDNSIEQLREKRTHVAEKLDDMESVSADSWMSMKGQIDAELANLERAYDQVASISNTR
jgi:hypothetical protein